MRTLTDEEQKWFDSDMMTAMETLDPGHRRTQAVYAAALDRGRKEGRERVLAILDTSEPTWLSRAAWLELRRKITEAGQ